MIAYVFENYPDTFQLYTNRRPSKQISPVASL